jgi:transposase
LILSESSHKKQNIYKIPFTLHNLTVIINAKEWSGGVANQMKMLSMEEHNALMSELAEKYNTTISALTNELSKLREESEILKKTVVILTAKVEELVAKSKKNSNNSDKPPSSDGPNKKNATQSLREKTGRKPGGQKGHAGSTLKLKAQPDEVVVLHVNDTCDCGGRIKISKGIVEKRQTTDIEPSKVITIEYRAEEGKCETCGKVHKSSFPEGVNATAVYGPGIKTVLTYMTNYQHLPLERAVEFVKEIYGMDISQGTIINTNKEVFNKLGEVDPLIKNELINSDVVGFDESGMRVAGSLHWLHCAATKDAVYYTIHKKRGKDGIDAAGILPNFKGTAIHDHWKVYYKYKNCSHSECNAHHLRHLVYLSDVFGQAWATEMICLLLRIKAHVDYSRLFGANELDREDIEKYENMYRAIIISGAEANCITNPYGVAPPVKTKRRKKTEAERMLIRLSEYEQEALMFMYDFDVPFDNNIAEAGIRMPKLHQKISGCFRTEDGADVFARIRSFIGTVKKKGKNIMEGLRAALDDNGADFLYPDN